MTRDHAAVLGIGAVEDADAEPPAEAGVDVGRLRRMDRFGRCGFLAGTRALLDAGVARTAEPDASFGVVFGTAFGCRDSITEHAASVERAARVEDLSPAIFAQTVHNTVAGELAIAWKLGGPSETFAGGRAAGLQAIDAALRALRSGGARRLVAGGAEGLHPKMREAARVERPGSKELAESGAALVLSSDAKAEPSRVRGTITGAIAFFEPDPKEASRRLLAFADDPSVAGPGARRILAEPDLDGAFERVPRLETADRERFGASGPWALVRALESAREGESFVVLVRDPDGACAAVAARR